MEPCAIKYIITKNQGYVIVSNKLFTYYKCLCKTIWNFLNCIFNFASNL